MQPASGFCVLPEAYTSAASRWNICRTTPNIPRCLLSCPPTPYIPACTYSKSPHRLTSLFSSPVTVATIVTVFSLSAPIYKIPSQPSLIVTPTLFLFLLFFTVSLPQILCTIQHPNDGSQHIR